MLKLGRRKKPAAQYETMSEAALVHAILHEKPGAWEAFVQRYGAHIYTLCAMVCDAEDLEKVCLTMFAAVREEDFAVLRTFDGRATLTTYLTLVIGNRLADQILGMFSQDTDRAWRAFERFFQKDIRRAVAHTFPSGQDTSRAGSTPEDRYQEICLHLLEHECYRIKAYNGQGAFAGYIHRIVRHVCIDLKRKEDGRRRLPERIQQLAVVEQEVFKALYWDGQAAEVGYRRLLEHGYTVAHAEKTLDQLHEAAETGRLQPTPMGRGDVTMADIDGLAQHPASPEATLTPEQMLIEEETQTAQATTFAMLHEAVAQLPDDEQRFIRLRYLTIPQIPPRDIARLMERSAEEVYKIGRRAVAHLQTYLHARGVQSAF